MEKKSTQRLPFKVKFSLSAIFDEIENSKIHNKEFHLFLKEVKKNMHQVLEGVESIEEFENLIENIEPIIDQIFPQSILKNNLKALGFPFYNKFFFPTDDLKQILCKPDTRLNYRTLDLSSDDIYKLSCCLILKIYYGVNIASNQSNILEIENDFSRFLSVNYDFDYFKLRPINKNFELDEDQIEELLNNYENTSLWYKYFPVESWEAKGIAIATMFDTTTEVAISNLKSNLISITDIPENINEEAKKALKSIFRLNDLEIGFSNFNSSFEQFEGLRNKTVKESLILNHCENMNIDDVYCTKLIERFQNLDFYVITNVDKYEKQYSSDLLVKNLKYQGIKSIILYPLSKDNENLGILEIASKIPGAFNRINALMLKDLIPLIENSIYRFTNDFLHQVNSFIQTEFTALHPSVDWKFRNIAKELILNPTATFTKSEISFRDVYPIYGEIDVRNSSYIRNQCTKIDYQNQIKLLIKVCEELYQRTQKDKFLDHIHQLDQFLNRIDLVDKIYFEREIFDYISVHIHTEIPKYVRDKEDSVIKEYLMQLDHHTGLFYVERKKFDESIQRINSEFSSGLDQFQIEAQKIYPHYYERFRTDGIDFNLYIGKSIAPKQNFTYQHLRNIRLWQLNSMITLEQKYHTNKKKLPLQLEVASLILTSNMPLDIIFKMDEKRFDVDGYNNAKYEIIKKRINKAYVKDSDERINIPGKICIIYTEDVIKEEYLNLINILIAENKLLNDIEILELEDLQGVGGLLAIRVSINYY